MNSRNLRGGLKQLTIGVVGEALNFITYGAFGDEAQTYEEAKMLPHSYTLQGIGKILRLEGMIKRGIILEEKARQQSKQKKELINYIENA